MKKEIRLLIAEKLIYWAWLIMPCTPEKKLLTKFMGDYVNQLLIKSFENNKNESTHGK
jgi:hypothetical protein